MPFKIIMYPPVDTDYNIFLKMVYTNSALPTDN